MRYFLSKRLPDFTRVLLIESGNRELFEDPLRDPSESESICVPTSPVCPRTFARGITMKVPDDH